MKRSLIVAAALLSSLALPANAALIGVNWAADGAADGLGSGTLGSIGVSLVSTDGAINGGTTFTADWPGQAGTNNVPGIAALAGANRNAVDWNAAAVGTATITFTGGTVTNPILLFDFTDDGETFDFADGLTISILDQNPAGSVVVAAGNVVTIDNSPSNTADDGFALELIGTFSSISFNTNLAGLSAQSVGFSIAIEETAQVPVPGTVALFLLGMAGLGLTRRNRA